MRLTFLSIFIFCSLLINGQSVCDSLTIEQVHIDAFFNDIGFDDYADEKLARELLFEKYERDQHEIRYELSQRPNVDSGLGAKIYRRKKAKKRHGKNKSKNR